MTIKELGTVIDGEQELVIISNWRAAGFYRCKADSIPPALLGDEVSRVFPHHNGIELSIETTKAVAER